MANYGRPGQWIDFYERNPEVVELFDPASDKRRFHAVKSAVDRGVNVRIFSGDELNSLTRGPQGFYQVLIVEMGRTERTNYIQRHATPQAFAIFKQAIAKDGVICFHTSSANETMHFDIINKAWTADLHVYQGIDRHRKGEKDRFWSDWLVVSPRRLYHLVQPTRAMPRFTIDPDPVRFDVLAVQ